MNFTIKDQAAAVIDKRSRKFAVSSRRAMQRNSAFAQSANFNID
jgi:hypothetical protein